MSYQLNEKVLYIDAANSIYNAKITWYHKEAKKYMLAFILEGIIIELEAEEKDIRPIF